MLNAALGRPGGSLWVSTSPKVIFELIVMYKLSSIIVAIYFLSGSLLLPMGDFSTLCDLPKMYEHCKVTEDPDMDIPDFITEHLLDIDGLLGINEEHDENEKPHQPVQFHHQSIQINFVSKFEGVNIPLLPSSVTDKSVVRDKVYHSDYLDSVFRPPIA